MVEMPNIWATDYADTPAAWRQRTAPGKAGWTLW